MIDKINKMLDFYKNENSSTEHSYYEYRSLENGEEKSIEEDIANLFHNAIDIKYDYVYIYSFESPGYDVNCYVLTVVMDNQIYNFPLNYENY